MARVSRPALVKILCLQPVISHLLGSPDHSTAAVCAWACPWPLARQGQRHARVSYLQLHILSLRLHILSQTAYIISTVSPFTFVYSSKPVHCAVHPHPTAARQRAACPPTSLFSASRQNMRRSRAHVRGLSGLCIVHGRFSRSRPRPHASSIAATLSRRPG